MRFLLLAVLLTCSVPAFADMLWAVDTNNTNTGGNLWTIDTTTGAATQMTTTSTGVGGDISWLDGTLYAGAFTTIRQGFGTIDPLTGVVTTINGSYTGGDVAANPSTSVLYDVWSGTGGLNILTPAGSVVTHLSGNSTDSSVEDLAYDAVHGVLYGATTFNTLVSIDTSTGDATVLGTMFPGRGSASIAYDWMNNTLYVILFNASEGMDDLYSLDPTNGTPTLIGPTGITNQFVTGFADLPTPEPASGALIAIGLAGFWLATRRRTA